MANQWQRCALDDDSLQQLNLYKQELADAETEIQALVTTMKSQIADLNRTSKVAATLTTKSDDLNVNHRIKMTAATKGTDIHKYTLILANPGANLSFNWLVFLLFPNLFLRIHPPQFGVEPTTEGLDKTCYDANVIYVEVETDNNAVVWTNPLTLKTALTAAGYDALFTSEAPDTYQVVVFFVVITVSLPVVADGTQYKFSGGKDTPLQDLTNGFNDLYAGTGKDTSTALEQLGIPVAKSTQTAAEVMSQVSNLIPLSTGKLVKCSGTNLTSLRALWTLFGGSSSAATMVCEMLPGTSGYALVVWTQQVTTTTILEACDGGGTKTTTTTEVVGEVNERPASTTGMTPYLFWLEKISPTVESLSALTDAGLSNTQIETALDASEATVYVIPEPSILTTYGLTCAELLELFLLDCEGVTTLSVQDALADLGDSPATAANGFVSASFNLPGGPSGVNIRKALSPETAMADSLAALSENKCLDPFSVGSITSLIASASAMIDMATGTVEGVRSTVMGTLNTISGLVANIQGVLSNAEKLGCLIPLDFMASVKAPALDSFLLPQIELAVPQLNGLLDTIQQILEKVNAIICKVVSAINSLLGPAVGTAECLVPGITNALANAFGAALPNPLDALPCVENPFDLVGLFQELLGKINSLSNLMTSMLNDILSIASQLQLSVNIADQTGVKEATGDCSSGPLGAIASSIKSKLSV